MLPTVLCRHLMGVGTVSQGSAAGFSGVSLRPADDGSGHNRPYISNILYAGGFGDANQSVIL